MRWKNCSFSNKDFQKQRKFWEKSNAQRKKVESDIDICVTMCYNLVTLILEKQYYD